MKQNEKIILPIDSHIPEIIDAVKKYSTIIIKASPGSGKTTRLPWRLSEELNQKVAVLEPRRLAAKLAAQRIADENRIILGKEIGYHFRFDKNFSSDSKVIFYTEGTFLKKFIHQNSLENFEIVVLDEFHERHLETDLALGLLLELQKKKNLKIILMSATIETDMTNLFINSKSIEISSPLYPVEIRYLPNQPSLLNMPLELKVKKSLEETSEDTLVFLPGMREMLRTKEILGSSYNVLLLHADLPRDEQQKALLPSRDRKIILSTNIAESSVTIPGVKTVIDSGIQRESWYSPWNGLKFIHDVPVTKSSAVQRAGRAGRTGPGTCYRLFSEFDFNERNSFTVPEIDKADLTDICLLIKGMELTPLWPKKPSQEKWDKAINLLTQIGALHEERITPIGRRMLDYPLEARLSRILCEGEKLNLEMKEKLLRYICTEIEQDKAGSLKQKLNFYLQTSGSLDTPWEKCFLTGFIDQVAKYRPKQRDFIHFSGKIIKSHQNLEGLHEGLYLILNVTQRQEANQVLSIWEEWLWTIDPFPIEEDFDFEVDEKITIKTKTKVGSIVLHEQPLRSKWSTLDQTIKIKISPLLKKVSLKKIELLRNQSRFERLSFWAKTIGIQINSIVESIDINLYFEEYEELDWENFEEFFFHSLEGSLNIKDLEKNLPSKMNFGGRRELIIHYPLDQEPYLEAPIQDFYGIKETPTILGGKISLTIKLLGPHKRPIQITKDINNFWKKTYKEMKKEYERDYPRHYWPENPWEAKPFLLKSHLPKT